MNEDGNVQRCVGEAKLSRTARCNRKGEGMASVSADVDLVSLLAAEMSAGVERAVECWMAQVEHALTDTQLTTLGRLNAVRDILARYKTLTGKTQLEGRRQSRGPRTT